MSLIGDSIFLPGMSVPSNPIVNAPVDPGAGWLFGGIAGGLFTGILGNTIGGFMRDVPWGTQADADAKIAEWLKNNPLMPDGSSRIREPVAAPSAPGYVKDEQGYYRNTNDPTDQGYYVISGNTPIRVTPPLVPAPKPTTAPGAAGSPAGGSQGANQPTMGPESGDMNAPVDMDGGFPGEEGFVDLDIDPDLVGGFPDTGTGDPTNPSGPTPVDQTPVEYSADEWYDIISDWFIRFPNATKQEAITAAQSVGVPSDILNEEVAQRFPSAPTNGNGGKGTGGSGEGTGGTGGGSTPTVPVTPTTPSDGSGGGSGGDSGSGTGGSGTGTGTVGMLTGLSPTRTTDELFAEELWRMKTPQAEVLDRLTTYGFNPGMLSPMGMFRV